MSTTTMLPAEFAELEPFAKAWVKATERERYDQRLATSMPELQEFYNAISARASEALTYLDQFPLDDMPEQQLNLMRMLYALCTISFAVDCFKQPKMPDSGSAYLDVTLEPYP